MEETKDLFSAGVNVKVDIPKNTWIWLGGSIALAGLVLILCSALSKKILA